MGIYSLCAQSEYPTPAEPSDRKGATTRRMADATELSVRGAACHISSLGGRNTDPQSLQKQAELQRKSWESHRGMEEGESYCLEAAFCRLLRINFKIPDALPFRRVIMKTTSIFYSNSGMSDLYSERMEH